MNDSGRLVHNAWYELPERFPRLQLDAFTIMPNHVHGILIFFGAINKSADKNADRIQGPNGEGVSRACIPSSSRKPSHRNVDAGLALPQGKARLSLDKSSAERPDSGKDRLTMSHEAQPGFTLGDVVRTFKSLSTRDINRQLSRSGPIWQRNYYEHVIRNAQSLNLAREYIFNNSAKWAYDRESQGIHQNGLGFFKTKLHCPCPAFCNSAAFWKSS
ncbi:MAG: hypothetical protein JEZ02_17700 [Desulfatibacillum sp.]|nr:hypothetical protein [Desulfatibacillum sp.]